MLPYSLALADSAFLLGYRLAGGAGAAPEYRTALVVADSAGVRVAAAGPGLVVSRPDGLWSVGVTRVSRGSSRRDVAVAARVGTRAARATAAFRDGCREATGLTFLFVGPTHASIEAVEDFECPAREYRYRDSLLGVVPFGRLVGATASTLERATLGSVVGPAATARLVEAARRTGVRPVPRDASSLDVFNWALVRRQGRWIVRARHRRAGGPNGQVVDFTVPVRPPRSLVGDDVLVPSWEAVARAVPGALDAFSSPAGDLTVVLRGTELLAFRVLDGRLESRSSARIALPGPPAAVVAQWTVGTRVRDWVRRVRSALDR